ncbi:hypothetical protein HYC85_001354 [Camellia sinensis]|uniref:beta-ketoacyl-[acyl-carrier-protein] synthase I n=1 Tax=Camellia sinensis TaxID=4442 RepID=A0A7J7I5S4_CAMSI|nr:hypothetical protein HYC85_001354 [Camellia sinensis]
MGLFALAFPHTQHKITEKLWPKLPLPSQLQKDPKKRIVITGMGLVSVLGNDVDSFYNKLLNGESGISLIDKFDASDYTVQIAGQVLDFSAEGYIDTTKDQHFDDSWRYCLVATKKALQEANLSPQVLETLLTFMIVPHFVPYMALKVLLPMVKFFITVDADLKQEYEKASFLYSTTNVGSALLAMETGFMGPTYSITTACSSANYCFYAAANHIKTGEVDIMVAGGTEAGVLPCGVSGFMACKALSSRNNEPQTASRPWDKYRDGFVLSEGFGLLVNYINAHATSTIKGDLAEINAIKKVFKDTSGIKMNGTKVRTLNDRAAIAAAGLEAIATIRAITTGWLHPTINQYNLEPEVTIDTIPITKIKHDVNVGMYKLFSNISIHNATEKYMQTEHHGMCLEAISTKNSLQYSFI